MSTDEPREPLIIEDYLVLQCPSCSRDVKVRTDALGQKLGCTFCRTQLQVAQWNPEIDTDESRPSRKTKDDLSERQPLVFREIKKGDIGYDPNFKFADDYSPRQLPGEAPAWDKDNSGQKVGPAGKPILTRKESIFRTITIIIMSCAAAVAALVIYSAVVRGLRVANKDKREVRDLPEKVQDLIDGAVEDRANAPLSDFLLSSEEKAAVAIVNGFLAANTVDGRLPFVRNPDSVAPLMDIWYANPENKHPESDGEVLLRDKYIDEKGRFFIRLAISFGGDGNRIFVVEQTREDMKLDWETAVGYQPLPYEDFVAERPDAPARFRTKLKSADYYNYNFADSARYHSVELSYPGKRNFKLMGYIDRTRSWAPGLIARLEAGEAPSVIVDLKFPAGKSQDQSQVEIVDLAADTWFL